MLFLLEMGYYNYQRNEKLLKMYKGDIQKVANDLVCNYSN